MQKMNKTLLAVALAGLSASALADSTPAAPSLGSVIAATPGLAITGYVAGTYDYFNTDKPANRQFETTSNGFTANQAALTVAYLPASGAGAQVTAIGGSDAQILRSGETYPSATPTAQFDLFNAFAQYAVDTYTLMAGKFSTLAGAEVATPNADNEISRSLLFTDMEPITHTGARVVDAISPAFTITAGVNNGWNYTSSPSTATGTSGKTFELGVSGTPDKAFAYSLAYYNGDSPLFDGLGSGVNSSLQLFDAVLTWNATDSLTFILNDDYLSKDNVGLLNGTTGTGTANGIALYANYALTPEWMLSLRGEYVNDSDGMLTMNSGVAAATFAGATSNTLKEGTIALNYTPVKNLKLSGELREDESSVNMFVKNGTAASSQTSVEFQAMYMF